MHKDLPYRYSSSENLPDEHKNKPIPIVYGSVHKAPIVYNQGVEYGERGGYVILADDFHIRELVAPKLKSESAYATIKPSAIRWEHYKEFTVYANSTSVQYEIIDNKLYIERTMEAPEATTDIEVTFSLTGMLGSPIAFGFVEVDLETAPIFTGGTYTLHWNYGSLPEFASTKILAFKDIEGQIPVHNPTENYFLYPPVFTSELGVEFPHPHWYFGRNEDVDDDLDVLYGKSSMTYDIGEGFSQGEIATELLKPDGDYEPLKYWRILDIQGTAEVVQYNEGAGQLPRLFFSNSDSSQLFAFPSNPDNIIGDPFTTTWEYDGDAILTRQIWDSSNIVHQYSRQMGDDDFELENQGGSMNYLNIQSLTMTRNYILKDFNKYDIYADVEGRIDNSDLRYTSINILSPSSMQQYYQDSISFRSRYSTLARPRISARPTMKKPVRKTIKKPVTKTPTKGGGKGGGY